MRKIVQHLSSRNVALPSGEILSAQRFLQLGLMFGFDGSGSSMNTIHYLIENAFVQSADGECLSYGFLKGVENKSEFNSNPIYSLLHEPLYCEGQASNWSAMRMRTEFPEFLKTSDAAYFTSEMIYPWMFDEYKHLKPLKELAGKLAEYSEWPRLYDVEVLRRNTVPVAACIYYGDIYVDRHLSEQTANNIGGLKFWITNEYEHDGLRLDGERILDRLLTMLMDQCP